MKNITIRVTLEGEVIVTAPLRCKEEKIEKFVLEKQAWIIKHLTKVSKKTKISIQEIHFTKSDEEEILAIAEQYLRELYIYKGPSPEIKFRIMKSRWGSCNKTKARITLNKALKEVPEECARYVVVHELAHLVEANHQAGFYAVVASILPDYKIYEKRLNTYALQD